MGVYSGPEIRRLIERSKASRSAAAPDVLPFIDVTPFDPARIGPNSIDVTLADKLLVYRIVEVATKHPEIMTRSQNPMDPAPTLYDCLHVDYENPTAELTIPKTGLILHPGALYLGSTVERTTTKGCVPWMDGRSSLGRLGVQIHATAGRGDDGFGDPDGCTWTLEITVTHPVFVRPNLRVGQITFFDLIGERQPYRGRYSRQQGPAASRLFEDALPPEEDEEKP